MRTILTSRKDGVYMNQYVPATVSVPVESLGGRRVKFEMSTGYPREDQVALRYDGDTAETFTLYLRIPSWASAPEAELKIPEGMGFRTEKLDGEKAGGYFAVNRRWKPGEFVYLSFGMEVKPHELNGHVAFTRGPLVLARDLRFGDGDIGDSIRKPFKCSPSDFAAVASPVRDIYLTCTGNLELGHHYDAGKGKVHTKAVRFCDYASAGNTWDERSAYRVWLPFDIAPECINME
jgi:hypothetical protein